MDFFNKWFLDDFYKIIEQKEKCKEIQESISKKEKHFAKKLPEELQAEFYSYKEEMVNLLKISQYEAFKIGLKAGLKKCAKVLLNK